MVPLNILTNIATEIVKLVTLNRCAIVMFILLGSSYCCATWVLMCNKDLCLKSAFLNLLR